MSSLKPKCSCPEGLRDPQCGIHGKPGTLSKMRDKRQIELESLRERVRDRDAQLAAIEGVKSGAIRLEDTKSVVYNSPTYCAFCNQMFGDAEDSTAQIQAHVRVCPNHPLATDITALKSRIRELEAEGVCGMRDPHYVIACLCGRIGIDPANKGHEKGFRPAWELLNDIEARFAAIKNAVEGKDE